MTKILKPVLMLATLVSITGASVPAEARHLRRHHTRHHIVTQHRPMVMIYGRRFTDSGVQVPEGSLNRYMTTFTIFNRTVIDTYRPDSFGGDVLPNRFNNPGRPQPLFEF